jgi:hypothetical protein
LVFFPAFRTNSAANPNRFLSAGNADLAELLQLQTIAEEPEIIVFFSLVFFSISLSRKNVAESTRLSEWTLPAFPGHAPASSDSDGRGRLTAQSRPRLEQRLLGPPFQLHQEDRGQKREMAGRKKVQVGLENSLSLKFSGCHESIFRF